MRLRAGLFILILIFLSFLIGPYVLSREYRNSGTRKHLYETQRLLELKIAFLRSVGDEQIDSLSYRVPGMGRPATQFPRSHG